MTSPTFAVVPFELVRCGRGLSHGAIKMAAWLMGAQGKRAEPRSGDDDRADWAINAEFWFTNAEAAEGLGVDMRTIKRWTRELKQAGILIGDEDGYVLGFDPTWRRWFPLPLTGAWALPSHQWRLWAVLASYANRQGLAWPRVDTLAKDAGLNARMVHKTLRTLEGLGAIKRRRRRRGSTMTNVRGVTRSADGGDTECTSKETNSAHQGGHGVQTSSSHVVPIPNPMFEVEREAAPHQPSMLLPITGGATGQEQQQEARQEEQAARPSEPDTREALEGYLSEAEAVLGDLGRSPVDQAMRGITLRRIADLRDRLAA